MGRRNKLGTKNRKQIALKSQQHLLKLLEDEKTPSRHQVIVRHLVATSRRHRLKIPPGAYRLFCKKCNISYRDVNTFRVRIKSGMMIHTCLHCASIRRIGGGPKFNRRT